LLAVEQLLRATGKYGEISIIEDAEADALKSQLRNSTNNIDSLDELLFYFTGHGYVYQDEFYHCAVGFDSARPNDTGLSTTELHTLLKLADARLVVKIIDSCYSGTLLIKSENEWFPQNKDGFKNLIQIASCLDSQNSLTGNPLSPFTDKFRAAALRKTEGPVYYTDIISTLRDAFIGNNSQTPFFVSQHTAREQFVDDAKRLDALRVALAETTARISEEVQIAPQAPAQPSTLLDRLVAADKKVATPELIAKFAGAFFDDLIGKISSSEFAPFFDVEHVEHDRFEELTTEEFMIRVLSNEKRADNFVTAEHTRKLRTRNPFSVGVGVYTMYDKYLDSDRYEETWHLRLNCKMERAQLKITLTPKFVNLQRVVLVVSCAPSLDHCYVFEMVTAHLLQDFGEYDADGTEVSRRWWKQEWRKSYEGIATQIAAKLSEAVRSQLESAEKRLSPPPSSPTRL